MITRPHLYAILALELIAVAFSAAMYSSIPDPAPTHWNFRGEPDRWGPPWIAAFLMPIVLAPVMALLVTLPLLGPFRRNFESFRVIYGRICVTVMTAMLGMHVVFVIGATGYPLRIGSAIAVVIGLLLVVLGNWMGKIRRNLYVGIRTPWTIANDDVWERTHRVGGWLLVAIGFATAITGVFAPSWVCFVVLMSGLGVLVLWAALYSLYWYRRLGTKDDLNAV